jgi:hypothetical protein
MPYGIQLYSATGQLLIDNNDRVAKFLGINSLNGSSGYAVYPQFLTGTPLWFLRPSWDYFELWYPEIYVVNQVIYWDYGTIPGGTFAVSGTLYVGVY